MANIDGHPDEPEETNEASGEQYEGLAALISAE